MPDIEYELIRSRRKTLSITVTREVRVVVRAPMHAPKKDIDLFVQKHARWIINKRELMAERAALPAADAVAEGAEFPYLGQRLTIAFTGSAVKITESGGNLYIPEKWFAEAEKRLRSWYMAQAAVRLNERLSYWKARTGIAIAGARLSGARKRWGSCSTKGRLNLTWRLVMAPPDVIDYVVVHELAHIEHPNHSRAFWARVGEILPDYKARKQWLKENSALLSFFNHF